MNMPTPLHSSTPAPFPTTVPPWWETVHEVSDEEQVLGRWARRAAECSVGLLVLAALILMAGDLVGPHANAALDGSPADPSVEQRARPLMPVQRPGLLASAQPDRVTMNSHVIGTLSRPQDWTPDLLQENHAPVPVDVEIQTRFNHVPSTWHRVNVGRTSTVVGDPSRDPRPARTQVLVASGSDLVVHNQKGPNVRVTVPPGRILWAYTVATPLSASHDAPSSATAWPTVVLRVGAVPREAVRAKERALDRQAIARLLTATVGAIGVGSLVWALLCRWGQRDLRQDRSLERRPTKPRSA